MMIKSWHGFCLCGEEGFPADATASQTLFAPLVLLKQADPLTSRGLFAIDTLEEYYEDDGLACFTPCTANLPAHADSTLAAFIRENGATVLNTAFVRAFDVLEAQSRERQHPAKITLVGLGDVGGTVLTGLKLLGAGVVDEVAIYDPNAAQCARYEMELNQVLAINDAPLPRITIASEDHLFDCDLFAFTAARGVPGLDSGVKDVRLAQFAANRKMIASYAKLARKAQFNGIFCQISDPVDLLAREAYLTSNTSEDGTFDAAGLLPEQVQGFGLGVMAARARYYAEKEGVDFSHGLAYGPHGQGLIIANAGDESYDDTLSQRLTDLTRAANLRVRDLGFKPYLAPGLSSAAISLIGLLKGEAHYGAVPVAGVYFGCQNQQTPRGLKIARESLCPILQNRLAETHHLLGVLYHDSDEN